MKTLGAVYGAIFTLIGILGFFPNPVIDSGDALFQTDAAHNVVHLLIGAVLLVASAMSAAAARKATAYMATLYLLLAAVGFIQFGANGDEGELLGFARANSADNWLHVGLAVVLYASTAVRTRREKMAEQWV